MIILVLGGIKSGKSVFAEKLADKNNNVSYIATNNFFDDEMKERIKIHKKRRPHNWTTIEESYELSNVFDRKLEDCCLIDCMTVYISNLLLKNNSKNEILNNVKRFLNKIPKDKKIIIVANEVGLSVIPENKLARKFVDIAGIVNQIIAEKSDEVYLCTAGIPMKIKGE